MRRTALAVLAVGALSALAPDVHAHTTATGLATFTVSGSTVVYRLTLVLSELPPEPAELLVRATDGDGASAARVADELRRRVTVRAGEAPCRPGRASIQGSRLGDSRVILELRLSCSSEPRLLVIRDDWFDLLGEHYRTIARIEAPGGVREAAFLPDARTATVDLGEEAPTPRGSFFRLGVEHILTGYDHLLFLGALLLRGGRPLSLLKIITAFTIAHSITLALAVLGLVTVPERLVECVIAASIVYVALENIFLRDAPSQRWVVSFLFGLVHGFGFASALGPLRLAPRHLALVLLSFNLGVEIGQAVVVALLLPVLVWMRGARWERRTVQAASGTVAVMGFIWLMERLFFV